MIAFCHLLNAQDKLLVAIDSTFSSINFTEFSDRLKQTYDLNIFFQPEWVEKVNTGKIERTTLIDEYLKILLARYDLHYLVFQDNIVILPGRDMLVTGLSSTSNTIIIGNPLDRGKYKKATITGKVVDGKTQTPIPGVQIICKEQSLATTSNANGEYTLELPVGENQLRFTFIGLTDEFRRLMVYSSGELNVELFEKTINLNQINVSTARPEDNYRSTSMGMVKLNIKTIKKLSVLMGEPDVIKGMTMLPGVQSTGENASGFNVRGGNIDQNLILVQETPVFNSSHLFGIFSMLDGSLVKDVSLYKSAIPAQFGGRIASVMDIELNKGQSEKLKINGGLGMINSRLSIETPIGKKTSIIVGGRSTYSDWLLNLMPTYELKNSSLYFYDFNAKIDHEINSKNKLSAFAYGSTDYFKFFESAEYGYGNLLGSVDWKHIYNLANSHNLNFNVSRYNANYVDFSSKNTEYKLKTSIQQEQLSYHFNNQTFARHKVNLGINAIRYAVEPGNAQPYNDQSITLPIDLTNEEAFELAAYVEDEFDLTPAISIIGGLRFSNFMQMSPDEVYSYQQGAPRNEETLVGSNVYTNRTMLNYFNGLEPRLALRYEMQGASSVKLGYNKTTQYIRQISNSISITPADYWKVSDSYLDPLIANQFAAGYFKNFRNNTYEASLEIYYKTIQNEVDYKNGARLVLNENLEQVLITGIGRAYGAELLIKKSKGDLTGWLAYTYSRSFKKIDGLFPEEKINKGVWYKSNYDKPHDLSLALNYKISRRYTLSSNFVYSTGRPITLPEQKYLIGTYEVVTYSDRNKYRLPDYHRLDVSITYEGSLLIKQKWRSSWTFSIYNLYGRNNAFSVFYEKQKPTSKNNYQTYSLHKLSVIGVPVPSFTYNFWF